MITLRNLLNYLLLAIMCALYWICEAYDAVRKVFGAKR